jgi:hypothetical protein
MPKTAPARRFKLPTPRRRADKRLVKETLLLLKRVRESGAAVDAGYSLAIPFSTRLNSKLPQCAVSPRQADNLEE